MNDNFSTQMILTIARSFPCLDRKLKGWHPKEFDADKFYLMMDYWSTVERLAGLFVLNVWDPGYAKSQGWVFDVFDFAGSADGENKKALIQWLVYPRWP